LNKLDDLDYYLVTYPSISRNGTRSDVKQALDAGCRIIQYREKNKSLDEMVTEAKELKQPCDGKAVFLIDDRVDVASAVDADGVHIGQDDISVSDARKILGDDKIIGLTVHNEMEAARAELLGVDYIGLAPIFKTDTKEDSGFPCGLEVVKRVRDITSLPLVAVGGINKENVVDVIRAGADGVVAVSSVLDSDNVYTSIKEFIQMIKEAKEKNDSA
jgi:thiamine-phosphate pyrophosphorylase